MFPPGCDCHCVPPCTDAPAATCASVDLGGTNDSNPDGDDTRYTLDQRTYGGAAITSLTLTSEPSGGYPGACLRLRVEWTQPDYSGSAGGHFNGDGIAAWALLKLPGGPHFSPAPWRHFGIGATCNSKIVAYSQPGDSALYSLGTASVALWQSGTIYGPSPLYCGSSVPITPFAGYDCWRRHVVSPLCGSSCGSTEYRWYTSRARETRLFHAANPTAQPFPSFIPQCYGPQDFLGNWDDYDLIEEVATPGVPPSSAVMPATPDLQWGGDCEVGFAFGFAADRAGNYMVELLLDNLCFATVVDEPTKCGELIIDEPLDTLPSGWDDFVWNWLDISDSPPLLSPTWEITDGLLTVDDMTDPALDPIMGWRTGFYARGSKWTTAIPQMPHPVGWCMTVEAEVWRINDRDIAWTPEDAIGGHTPHDDTDFNPFRPAETCGIFIGELCRLEQCIGEPGAFTSRFTGGKYGYRLTTPSDCDAIGMSPAMYDDVAIKLSCPTADVTYEFAAPSIKWDRPFTPQIAGHRTHLMLKVTKLPTSTSIECSATYLNFIYRVEAFVNGFRLTNCLNDDLFSNEVTIWFPFLTQRVGLCAHYGGRWSNFQVRVYEP